MTAIASPLDGTLMPLSEVPDPVFAQGLVGPGVALEGDGVGARDRRGRGLHDGAVVGADDEIKALAGEIERVDVDLGRAVGAPDGDRPGRGQVGEESVVDSELVGDESRGSSDNDVGPAGVRRRRNQIDVGRGDVEIAFSDALRRKYGVQVNQTLVDNLFDVGTATP